MGAKIDISMYKIYHAHAVLSIKTFTNKKEIQGYYETIIISPKP